MEAISDYTGRQIKTYRKMRGLTLQNLADRINKSRATVSKYESGDIILDIETLDEIAKALNVELEQLVSNPEQRNKDYIVDAGELSEGFIKHNPFYESRRLYLYYYDGRSRRLKDGIIDIFKKERHVKGYKAALTIRAATGDGRSGDAYYSGSAIYSDMLIRFSFLNLYNTLEEDLLYIFNPMECREFTEGLLCGISSSDLLPCAFKCIVSLNPIEDTGKLKKNLMIERQELQRWQRLNMMVVDNRPKLDD